MPFGDWGYWISSSSLPTCLLPVQSPHLPTSWLCPVPLTLGTSLELLRGRGQSLRPPTSYLVFTPSRWFNSLPSTKTGTFTHSGDYGKLL